MAAEDEMSNLTLAETDAPNDPADVGAETNLTVRPDPTDGHGGARALCEEGKRWYYGRDVPKDEARAFACFSRAGELGDAEAMCMTGLCLFTGTGTAKDEARAVSCYTQAAARGSALAMAELGVCCRYGIGVKKSPEEAFAWYKRSANHGSPTGLFEVGRCLEEGFGTAKDPAGALGWYKKAAALGNRRAAEAAERLSGRVFTPEQKSAQAYREEGDRWYSGSGVPKDETRAFECYAKAVQLGDGEAALRRGFYSFDGRKDADQERLFSCFLGEAVNGKVSSMEEIASCFLMGTGTKSDPKKAFEWYGKAALKGSARGMFGLGRCYEDGLGVEKDDAMALACYRKAVGLGNSGAQLSSARLQGQSGEERRALQGRLVGDLRNKCVADMRNDNGKKG